VKVETTAAAEGVPRGGGGVGVAKGYPAPPGPPYGSNDWKPEEDQLLLKLAKETGGRCWRQIAEAFPNHSDIECMIRWKNNLSGLDGKGSWTKEEDDLLYELVLQYGPSNWAALSKELNEKLVYRRRSAKQCRERWINHMDPSINRDAWTPDEDDTLMKKQKELGNKWTEISRHIPGRTELQVKNRYRALMKFGSQRKPREPRDPNKAKHTESQPSTSSRHSSETSRQPSSRSAAPSSKDGASPSHKRPWADGYPTPAVSQPASSPAPLPPPHQYGSFPSTHWQPQQQQQQQRPPRPSDAAYADPNDPYRQYGYAAVNPSASYYSPYGQPTGGYYGSPPGGYCAHRRHDHGGSGAERHHSSHHHHHSHHHRSSHGHHRSYHGHHHQHTSLPYPYPTYNPASSAAAAHQYYYGYGQRPQQQQMDGVMGMGMGGGGDGMSLSPSAARGGSVEYWSELLEQRLAALKRDQEHHLHLKESIQKQTHQLQELVQDRRLPGHHDHHAPSSSPPASDPSSDPKRTSHPTPSADAHDQSSKRIRVHHHHHSYHNGNGSEESDMADSTVTTTTMATSGDGKDKEGGVLKMRLVQNGAGGAAAGEGLERVGQR